MPEKLKLFKYRPNAHHHVTFATKRRKLILAGPVRERVHYWFGQLAQEHGFQLLEYNSWLDHVHMLIFVRIGEDLSFVMNILKGTCAHHTFRECSDLKMQIHENHLWGWRFYAEEVPVEALDEVRQYIRDQEKIHGERAMRLPIAAWERWRDLDL
jgi:putative transposase